MDLIILRKDNVASVCEMKFYNAPFTVNKEYHFKIVQRNNQLAELLPRHASIHNVLVSTYGIKDNEYSGDFQSVVCLDDLFR